MARLGRASWASTARTPRPKVTGLGVRALPSTAHITRQCRGHQAGQATTVASSEWRGRRAVMLPKSEWALWQEYCKW